MDKIKIIGNTTATPMTIPDWNQTDPKKADYIKNKPIPPVTTSDNGKFLRVVDGAWAVASVPSAEEVAF